MRLPSKFILIVFCLCSQAGAQIVRNVAVNQVRVAGGGAFGADEAGLEASMKLEVDAIRRVTGISDSATKKLEVAAIAAVKNALKKGTDVKLNEGQQTAPAPQKDSLSDEDAELKTKKPNPDNRAQLLAQVQAQIQGMRVLNADTVKNEEIWTKTLANVLSAEQSEQYKAFLKDRKKRDRDFVVQSVVNQMDGYLLLTESQRTALTALIDRVQGDELAAQMQQRAGIGGMGAIIIMRPVQQSELSQEALKEILSPAQLAEHKRQKNAVQDPLAALGMGPKPEKKDQTGFSTGLGFNVGNEPEGLKILSVEEGAAAEKAGLRVGDIVDSIGNFPVDSIIQLKRALNKIQKPFQIHVRRDGNTIQLELTQ